MLPPYSEGIRKNPTPTEWVAAWYENKETALWEGRKAGRANGSPRDPQQSEGSAPETQPR
jgi:hypothetical protein